MASCALVVVATEGVYTDFAREFFLSADPLFKPTHDVEFVLIEGETGWPRATYCRHRLLLKHLPETDYVFLVDADMRVEEPIGPEILGDGITATIHPGYWRRPEAEWPYVRWLGAATAAAGGEHYYAGGFFGGTRDAMRSLLLETSSKIAHDAHLFAPHEWWHCESALNSVLAVKPPAVTLDPSYCHPDRDSWYVQAVWGGQLPRRLVALDKTPDQRAEREAGVGG